MDYAYAITPFFAWALTGSIKFAVNSFRAGRLAFDLIGYGGMPSNHAAIVCSAAAAIAFGEGVKSPAFGVAVTLAFIVMMDAKSLRRQVGEHAVRINRLTRPADGSVEANAGGMPPLRERMGHKPSEILAGAATGVAAAVLVRCALALACKIAA